MTEFIYFDIGNVLLFFDHHRACRQVGPLVGLSAAEVYRRLFDPAHLARYETGQISSQQYYQVLTTRDWPGDGPDSVNRVGRDSCREEDRTGVERVPDSVIATASDIFQLNTSVVPIVTQLQSAGYRLGVLSNTCASHWQFISRGRYSLLSDFFPVRILSFEQQCLKPQGQIYERAIEAAGGVGADRIIFVDDRAENVTGAREAGLDAVRFHNASELAADLRGRGVAFNY